MSKTVLFISPTGTLDNGAEISIVNLMKFLVDRGCRVLNVFPDYKVASQEEYRTAMQELKLMAFQQSNGGGKKHQVAYQVIILCE